MKRPTDSEADRKKEFREGMGKLAGAFRVDLTKRNMSAFWSVLGGYDCARMRRGFDGALNHETFFPSPAKVREYIPAIAADYYPELT